MPPEYGLVLHTRLGGTFSLPRRHHIAMKGEERVTLCGKQFPPLTVLRDFAALDNPRNSLCRQCRTIGREEHGLDWVLEGERWRFSSVSL